MNLDEFLENGLSEITRAKRDKRHPFRQMVISTIADNKPQSRMVILRKYEKMENAIYFYTDQRSSKVIQITDNPQVSVLFWHPKKRLQLRVDAVAEACDQKDSDAVYRQYDQELMRDYNTVNAPGAFVSDMDNALVMKSNFNSEHFTMIKLNIEQFELLQLDRNGHRRALYQFENNKLKRSSWLVP